jgi:uncharacterized lipoprotein YajG
MCGEREENNSNLWTKVSVRYVDIEKQNMEASMREMSNLENKLHIQVHTQEANGGISWWKVGIH